MPPGGRVAGWPGGRVAGWPGGRVAGWPGGRVAGWPGGRVAGWPGGPLRLWGPAMRVGPWRRWGHLLSSRSEASCSSSTVRFRLGSPLLPLLLGLPLVAGLGPTRAQAQVACATANSDGSYTVPGDWALKPSGLASGASFRLLFVTSTTRDATATDIATYNTFVQDRAKAGHSAISDSCGNLFKVVGSTTAVHARDNTATTGMGMPIYWLSGAKAADNYADFYDEDWDSVSARDESGNSLSSVNRVWTGSNPAGEKAAGFLGRSNHNIQYGSPQIKPLSIGGTISSSNYPFYGLSPVFTVGPSGPPTVTLSLSGTSTTVEGSPTSINVNLSSAVASSCRVKVGARRADGTLWTTIAVIPAGAKSGRATVTHNDDDIWHRGGYYDMPVWVASQTEGCRYNIGAGSGESDTTYSIRVKDNDQISVSFSGPANVDSEEFSRNQPTTVIFSPDPGQDNLPTVLNFKVSGTATEGEDYAFASTVTRNGDVYTSSGTNNLGQRVIDLDFIDDDVDEGTETIILTLEPGAGYVVDEEENQRTLEILDDEAPTTIYTLSLEASPLSADEGDPNRDRLVTFAITPAPTISHIVNFTACFTGTASRNVDYQIADISNSVTHIVLNSSDITGQPGCRRVTVYPGASSGSFKVRVSRDGDFEADETVAITLKPSSSTDWTDTPGAFAVSATAGSVELVIVNDDDDPSLPAIFFDPRYRSRAENVGTVNWEIFSSRDLVSALTVTYRLSGTATCGTDYTITGADCTAGTGAFTFPANTTARTPVLFPITVIDDDISDNGETIIVTLTDTRTDGYGLPPGFIKTFTLTLYDDTGSAAISVSGTPRVGAPMTINWDSDDPDGNGSGDPFYFWQFRATSSDRWNDYEARQRGCGQRATTCRPTHSEGNPTVGGYFRGLVSYTDGNGLGTTVYSNNAIGPFTAAGPGIVLPATDVTLREGRTASYNLKLATDPGAGATVRVSITSGDTGAVTVNDTQSGVNGTQNYLDFSGGSGGSWNTHQAVTVRGVQDADTTNEADVLTHAVSVQAGSSAPYTGLANRTLNVDVTDDDTLPPDTPVVSITASPSSITEGGTIAFTLTASPAPTGNITVVINFTAGVRFAGVGRLTRFIPPSGTRSFTVVTYNDDRDEASGPVTATVGRGTGYVPHITEGSASVIVNDNDDPPPNRPVVSISGSPSSMTEGGTATFTLTASPAPTASIAVGVQVVDSGDFAGAAAGLHTVSIPSSGAASFTIPTTDDGTDEPDGTITATVNTGTGYSPHNTEWSASAIVNDNDDPGSITPVVSIEGSPSSMTEGGTATFTLTASPAPTGNVSVAVTVAGGSFATGGDRTVTVGTSGTATFTVATTDDTTDEPNGTITATVNTGTGYAPHSTEGSASVTVNDNDNPGPNTPVASFGSAASSAGEDGGTRNVRVSLSPAPQSAITLSYTVGGTATAGTDFSIANSGSVQAPANTASVTIPVTITEDTDDEANETVILTLGSGTGYSVGSGNIHTLTINDNDDPLLNTPVVSITGSPSSMTEGDTATFTLTASPAPTEDLLVTVQVMDSGDFASGGAGPQTVTVDTSGTAVFTVSTTDDEMEEPNGTITATVNTGTGYSPHNTEGSAAVTVNDNDGGDGDGGGNDGNNNDGGAHGGHGNGGHMSPPVVPPTVGISRGRAVITEGDHAVFTLTASPAPREDISVTVQVMDSGDFASGGAGLRMVSIPPSGAASFTVPTMDDHTDEPNGTITVTVNTGIGYAPHTTDGSASVTVNDNDVPGLRLPRSSLTVARGGSSSYTIRLSTRPSEPVTVSIRVVPAGAGLTVDTDPGRDGNQTTLTFRADDWNVPQRVVVTAPEQAGSITLTHTATGDHYDGVTAAMTVRVADIDPDAVRGWHVRWGRTISQQVVDALQDRFAAVPTPPGLHLRVAGEELTSAVPLAENRQVLAKALGFEKVTAEQLVQDSAFSFSPVGAEAARFALWGRGALSSFSGQEDTVSLEGEVSTALVGAEWRAERWQAGAALSRSWGSGSYGGAHRGEVDTSGMTGLFPYGRYALTPRLGIWAVVGWGWGQLSLQPDGTAGEYQPGTKLSMTAVGMDGLLLDGGAEGLSLVSTAEVLRVRTVSEDVADLAGSEGVVSRRRLGLEATRAFPLSNGAALSPSLSVGIREDGGDGETGFGLEMGAGLLWADPARGVRGELQGRSLLSHVEEEFREQGLALSFAWDPTPGNRGPSFSLSHAVGATAAGGMDALLQPTAIQVLDDAHGGQQFAAELAYGVSAFADRFTLSPGVGLVLSPDGAVYSLGWALAPYAQQVQTEPWEVALEGKREQRSATTSADHSLTLRFSLLF